MKSTTLICFFIYLVSVCSERARFDNYRVYSIQVKNEDQLKILARLENDQDGLIFLRLPVSTNTSIEIVVPPHKFADFAELCEKYEMHNEVTTNNLQDLIDEEQPQTTTRAAYGWKQYYNLNDVYAWLDEMLRRFPNELTNYNIGKSHERRTIRAIKLSRKPERRNPIIFIESTIHAREWITLATTTYILNELLRSNDPEIVNLADNFDWVFVPVVNVDGYKYSHENNRMWRKNRKPQSANSCIGVDANRNFGFHHAENGASKNPCSEQYAGAKAFSEPETRALAEFVKTFNNIKLYLSFHSYGQMLLFPYGHSKQRAVNYNNLIQIGFKAKEAIQRRYGTQYTVGSISEVLYLASGTSIDWVYATQNVPLAYTFEFRDSRNGSYGSVLPPSQIIPNALETIDGLKAMLKEARLKHYF